MFVGHIPDVNIMVDIETLSTEPNAAVVQIGACVFRASDGSILETIQIDVEPDPNAHVDFKVIEWWMNQSTAAKDSVFQSNDRVSEACAANRFKEWYQEMDKKQSQENEDLLLWAKPPSFDMVILEQMMRRGVCHLPWSYRSTRDLRTLIALVGHPPNGYTKPEIAHNALSDAIAQAKDASALLDKYKRTLFNSL
jgi:hypothetical protein